MKLSSKLFLLSLIFSGMFFVNINPSRAEDTPPSEPDTTAPVITLLGDANVSLNVGDTYVDAGARASDNLDGDITAKLVVENLVNTSIAGSYTVTYAVSDLAGNQALPVIRNVVVNSIPQETFIIRQADKIIWQGSVSLPGAGTAMVNDSKGQAHSINSQSVLALLYSIDQASESFSISNLEYYDSFGSFYLKCITPQGGAELCDNWQYAVGSTTPNESIDLSLLSGSKTVGIFFGSPHQLTFNSTSIRVGSDLLVKAEKYNYLDNSWGVLNNVSIGITLPNPADPWNPKIVSTRTVDASGNASFTISEANTYNVGIVEDYYFPSYQLLVSLPTSAGPIEPETVLVKKFDIDKALLFLKNSQSSDGSFVGAGLYTDWVAIAYGAASVNNSSRDLLLAYLKNKSKLSSNLTDNERRVMGLLALGQNPYDFEKTNYVESIVKQFDGLQFGDKNLVNDDIFALIPLLSCGYDQTDEIITKDLAYIISKQETNGSWNNSVDLSSAAVQLLSLFDSNELAAQALSKAEKYIVDQQKDDGGFESVYTTSWAEQARLALAKTWQKNNNTAASYLINQQSSDGGILVLDETLANRVWATSYVVPAILGKTWNKIFVSVKKQNVLIKDEAQATIDFVPQISAEENNNLSEITTQPAEVEFFQNAGEVKKASNKERVVNNEINLGDTIDQPSLVQEQKIDDGPAQKDSPFKKELPFIAGVFIIVGAFFVVRLWV